MSGKREILISMAGDEDWDDLVRRFPDRTVFHGLPWLTLLCEAHRLKRLLIRADADGQCVAVWPCLDLRRGPFRIVGSPLPGWSTAYLGPLFAPGVDLAPVLEAVFESPFLRRWSYFRFRVIDEHREIDLQPRGFSRLAREETYLLDLSAPEAALWNNLKSECRSRIRKAQRQGVEVRVEHDDQFLEDFWLMSCEVFAKSKLKPPFTREFARLLIDHLRPAEQVVVLSAFCKTRRIATLILPHNDHTMYYWAGGTFQEFRDLPSNNLLHWSAILEAKRMGLARYDFISTVGGPGRFKKTFAPEARFVATHWEASRHRLIGALKDRYEGYLRSRRALKV